MGDLRECYEDQLAEGADGLSKSQAFDALCEAGTIPTALDIVKYYKDHNKEDDDLMTFEELEELSESLGDPVQMMREAFSYFDRNNDGKIDKDELRGILEAVDLGGCGTADDKKFLDYTFEQGDVIEKDGFLDVEELVEMVRSGLLSV